MASNELLAGQGIDQIVEVATLEVARTPKFTEAYSNLVKMIDQLSAARKLVDEKLKSLMQEEYLATGVSKIEGEDITLSYVAGTFRDSFDTKKFEAEHPKMYKQYIKSTLVSDSVRATKKKEKK